MNKPVIVIPIYKETLSASEGASFKQCLKTLGHYDIVLVAPRSLNAYNYNNIARRELTLERFDDNLFVGLKGYNCLCLSYDFYNRFSKYDYMLIHQLDVWVFRDELQLWCEKNYDYIGAPFAEYTDFEKKEGILKWVGNGGFSLRKISYFKKVLSWRFPVYRKLLSSWKGYLIPSNLLYNLGFRNTMPYILRNNKYNEDVFFSLALEASWFCPSKPLPEEAAFFSFENCASFLYEVTGHKLPFGCHAYRKYEYDVFWKKFIKDNN